MSTIFIVLITLVSLILGIAPIGYVVAYSVPDPVYVLIALNFIAWICASVLFLSRHEMLQAVDSAFGEMRLPELKGSLEKKLAGFLQESSRYHRASYSFHGSHALETQDLSTNLRRIVTLAYHELQAQSVELALYERGSSLWSQALVIGAPSSLSSQSMLVDASASEGEGVDSDSNRVIAQPLEFAGTVFGILRIELPDGRIPDESDSQVAYLLATQGALMLINSRFTDELLRMRQKSEESVQAKTGFLANLSHELRGPLSIILNSLELMMDGLCGPTTESQTETCKMAQQSGEHLLDLVNDVLDYAKVEAGKVIAKPKKLQLKPLLRDLTNVVRSQAMMKKHKLILDPVDEELGMICDKRHARQIIINFLTNAIKYTPDGGEIRVKAERMQNHRVKISISDTGVGIAKEEHHKVFGAFERVDNHYSLKQVGTGLGMPLTRKLAEVNEGLVDFESEEGKGSNFWIVLPAIEFEAQVESETNEDGEEVVKPQGHGESILLVDNDQEARAILEKYLVHQGFDIVNAASGAEVVKALRDQVVELAVVESDLPDASGEDIISVIRSNPKASGVPIILLSSKAFVFDVERFLKLGVDRCLSKPVGLSELASTARRLIDETKSFDVDLPTISEEQLPSD